tara:strand:+ start:541 stop:777 length:237 start_codon:yes stop_codon:yes gene_type:complete
MEHIRCAETGETIGKLDASMIGRRVIVETREATATDWIDEVYCPVCEAHMIGTRAAIGGFLARHGAYHGHSAHVIDQM